MEEQPIYAIYVMSRAWELDECNFPNCGSRECVGYYYEKETAIQAVEENWCDIQDCYAHAAEIWKVRPGLYQYPNKEDKLYYIWNTEKRCFEGAEFPELGSWGYNY